MLIPQYGLDLFDDLGGGQISYELVAGAAELATDWAPAHCGASNDGTFVEVFITVQNRFSDHISFGKDILPYVTFTAVKSFKVHWLSPF